MDYYVLELRSKEEKDMNLNGTTYDKNQDVVTEIFYKGMPLNGTIQSPFTVILDERRTHYGKIVFDKLAIDTHQAGRVLLISPKAQRVFADLELPIEFVDVRIKGKKLELEDYKFVNVIGRINCTDREKSSLEYFRTGVIQIYDSLVLDKSKIPDGTDLFLLGEDSSMLVIVSDRVKNAVEAAKLTGFEFKAPENYKTFR